MSVSTLRRLAAVKGKLQPDTLEILRPDNPAPGFDDDTWPAEIERRLAEARARGERVIEIKRFYGVPESKQPQQ